MCLRNFPCVMDVSTVSSIRHSNENAVWCAKGEAKERFNEIKQELSQISTKFSNNLLDATKAFKKLVTDKADVDGLPASALALGAQQVRPRALPCCTTM